MIISCSLIDEEGIKRSFFDFTHVPTPCRPPDKNRTLVPTPCRPPDKNRTLVPTSYRPPDKNRTLVPTSYRPPDKNRTLVPTSYRPPDKNRTLVPTLRRAFPLFSSLRATEGKRGNPVTSHPPLRAKRGNPHSSSARKTEKVIISSSFIGEEEVRESFFDFALVLCLKRTLPLLSSLRATEGKRGNPEYSSARLKSHKAERRD